MKDNILKEQVVLKNGNYTIYQSSNTESDEIPLEFTNQVTAFNIRSTAYTNLFDDSIVPQSHTATNIKTSSKTEASAKSCEKIKTFNKTVARAESNSSARLREESECLLTQENENYINTFSNSFTNKKKRQIEKKNLEKSNAQKSNLCLYKTSDSKVFDIKSITKGIDKFDSKINPQMAKLVLREKLLRSLSKTPKPNKQKVGYSPKTNKNANLLNGGNTNKNFNTQTSFNIKTNNMIPTKDSSNPNLLIVKSNKVKEFDFINLTPKKDNDNDNINEYGKISTSKGKNLFTIDKKNDDENKNIYQRIGSNLKLYEKINKEKFKQTSINCFKSFKKQSKEEFEKTIKTKMKTGTYLNTCCYIDKKEDLEVKIKENKLDMVNNNCFISTSHNTKNFLELANRNEIKENLISSRITCNMEDLFKKKLNKVKTSSPKNSKREKVGEKEKEKIIK